jgi:hypothetical protein
VTSETCQSRRYRPHHEVATANGGADDLELKIHFFHREERQVDSPFGVGVSKKSNVYACRTLSI